MGRIVYITRVASERMIIYPRTGFRVLTTVFNGRFETSVIIFADVTSYYRCTLRARTERFLVQVTGPITLQVALRRFVVIAFLYITGRIIIIINAVN